MTWEEKLAWIAALVPDVCLRMRAPGDWYVYARGVDVRVGSAGLLREYGNGRDQREAVEDHWKRWTTGQLLIKDALHPYRSQWRWGGDGWVMVKKTEVGA